MGRMPEFRGQVATVTRAQGVRIRDPEAQLTREMSIRVAGLACGLV